MALTIASIVDYKLSAADAARVEHARVATGRQGNAVAEGDVLPAITVRVFGEGETTLLNLQVILDGPDTLWVTSRAHGRKPGQWTYTTRA